MNLQQRIDLLSQLGEYILSNPESWKKAKEKAGRENGWFTPEFTRLASENIAENFLKKDILEKWASDYNLASTTALPRTIGIVMAGNIPLVGFHDLLAVFISGHKALVKPSSKDAVLVRQLVDHMISLKKEVKNLIVFSDMLKNCDAYIATGSNNSAGYFEYYFSKYRHIIRRNRTSVAILTGKESREELEQLADDVYQYFGLGCRNVTKLYVPRNYDFTPLLTVFKKYDHFAEHHKYKNNYDYNLALHLLNKVRFMSTASILLVEERSVFSPISQLNYELYDDIRELKDNLNGNEELQCMVGRDFTAFGKAQCPAIDDYADGVDTLSFLRQIH